MKQKTVLILGGTGFIGSFLRERLRREYRILTTSRSGAGADHAFDLSQAASTALFDSVAPDVVVNCAVAYGPTLEETFAINVCQSGTLFIALKDRPMHFVQISSLSALPENELASDYGFTKSLADRLLGYCAQKGAFDVSILRFAQVFDTEGRSAKSQPGLHAWVTAMNRGEPIDVYGRAPQKRSYMPVEVAVGAIELAIRNRIHGTHDVILPEAYTPLELARLLAELGGYDAAQIAVVDKVAPGYTIPACSAQFEPWLSEQKPISFFFAQLFSDRERR